MLHAPGTSANRDFNNGSRRSEIEPRAERTSSSGGLSRLHLARLKRFEDQSHAANTQRTYASQLCAFDAWCRREGLDPAPPVSPLVVAAWLATLADDGASRSTVMVGLAAIKFFHRQAGSRFDASDPTFTRVLAGVRRTLVNNQRQAAPLRGDLLKNMLTHLPATDVGRRDGALLALLYAMALRRSELAGLDYHRIGTGAGALRITPDALELVLLRSKTKPGESVVLSVPIASQPLCHAALTRWITHADIQPGEPFIRRILGQGGIGGRISADGVLRAVRCAVGRFHRSRGMSGAEADALAAGFSGHSGRVGLVVTAKEAGLSDSDIALTTRHSSANLIARYSRQAARTAFYRIAGIGV